MRIRTTCPHCGGDVEAMTFCGLCGQRLPQRAAPSGGVRAWLARLERIREVPAHLLVAIGAAFLVLLALLGGQIALALALAVVTVPLIAVAYLTSLDLYEREPWPFLLAVVGSGALVGLVVGAIASWTFERFWFDGAAFNVGAVGFGGLADGQTDPPASVIAINGLLLPMLAAVLTMAGPVLLRRWPTFRNEVMDGVTLGGSAAGGYAAASAMVYLWPIFFDAIPNRPPEEWTAVLLGVLVLRPMILVLAGGLVGAAIWHYSFTQRTSDLALPAVAGILGWVGYTLGQLYLQPTGALFELGWSVLILVALAALFREALRRGLAHDRRVLGAPGERVICPRCRRVTPAGRFCAHCRSPLDAAAPALVASGIGSAATPVTVGSSRSSGSDRLIDDVVESGGEHERVATEETPSTPDGDVKRNDEADQAPPPAVVAMPVAAREAYDALERDETDQSENRTSDQFEGIAPDASRAEQSEATWDSLVPDGEGEDEVAGSEHEAGPERLTVLDPPLKKDDEL